MSRKTLFLIVVLAFISTACTSGTDAKLSEEDQNLIATAVQSTVQSKLTQTSAPTLIPTPTEPEYLDMDFSITPEVWTEIYGDNLVPSILVVMNEVEIYPYQYQLWGENAKVSRVFSKFPYDREPDDREIVRGSMVFLMGNEAEFIGFKEGGFELNVFDNVMESGLYMNDQYLNEDTQGVKATVVYWEKEDVRFCYYMMSDGGAAIYIEDGNIQVFPGNEIPDILSEEAKEKFLEGYTRVESTDGVVEGFCLWKW